MAVKIALVLGADGRPQQLQSADTLAGAGGSVSFVAVTKDLGASRSAGSFDITGLSGLTAGKPVMVFQTAAPIASKGDARDEPEMDQILATGYVVNATTIRVFWNASGVVVGDYAFAYLIGA